MVPPIGRQRSSLSVRLIEQEDYGLSAAWNIGVTGTLRRASCWLTIADRFVRAKDLKVPMAISDEGFLYKRVHDHNLNNSDTDSIARSYRKS
jgi:hypothetical protein